MTQCAAAFKLRYFLCAQSIVACFWIFNHKLTMISTHYTPPLGLPLMTLTVKNAKLMALDWHDDKTHELYAKLGKSASFVKQDELRHDDEDHSVAILTMTQLDEYFSGVRTHFDVPLDLSSGTPFQQAVWRALLAIEYGQTISYAKLAQNIAKPSAFRAAANANGKNPISLIVPCHRVIKADGDIGGYTGGVFIKSALLALERGAVAV